MGKLKQLYQSSSDNKSLWVEKVCYWFLEQVKDVNSGSNDPTFSKENNAGRRMNEDEIILIPIIRSLKIRLSIEYTSIVSQRLSR